MAVSDKVVGYKTGKASLTIRRIVAYLVLIILTVASLLPFIILFINTTRSHANIQQGFSFIPGKVILTNVKGILNNDNIPLIKGLRNSLFVATACAVLCTYFSALTAYGIHVYNFRLKKFAFAFIMLVMMVPSQVSALGFYDMVFGWGLKNNFIPLILPTIAAPATFFFMKQYMDSALPLEIVEAARMDGSNEFKTFNRIIMPIMKPAIAVQAIFTFVTNWNNYFMPALLLDKKEMKTLPVLIAQLRSANYLKFDLGQVYAMIAISIIPVILVYLFLSKFIIRGIALGSVKG